MPDLLALLASMLIIAGAFMLGRWTRPDRTLQIINAMWEGGGWMYAWDIGKAAGVNAGSLYSDLARLEHCFLVESRWDPDTPERHGRGRRREYRLRTA